MRNIAFEVLIYMEKKQIRLNIAIQKRNIKKANSARKDKQEKYAKEAFRKEIRRAFMSGWKKGVEYSENLKNKQKAGDINAKESIKEV